MIEKTDAIFTQRVIWQYILKVLKMCLPFNPIISLKKKLSDRNNTQEKMALHLLNSVLEYGGKWSWTWQGIWEHLSHCYHHLWKMQGSTNQTPHFGILLRPQRNYSSYTARFYFYCYCILLMQIYFIKKNTHTEQSQIIKCEFF